MLRQLARPLARRAVHTASAARAAPHTSWRAVHFAVGASAAASAVLAWQLNQTPIMLDAEAPAKATKPKPKAAEHPLSAKSAAKPEVLDSTVEDHTHTKDHPVDSAKSPFTPEHPPSTTSASPAHKDTDADADSADAPPEAEAESSGGAQGGAYNPETGEINWDCPCLGGMAHGPCGPQFREAFSCFIHSDAEPKGIECVEKFKGMQECFKEHPEIYAEEIMDDDDDDTESPAPTMPENAEGDVSEFIQDAVSAPTPMPAPSVKKSEFAPEPSSSKE